MTKKASKKYPTQNKNVINVDKNSNLLTFGTLSSKNTDPEYRRDYLKKVSEIFTINELAQKWKTSERSIHKFYISNNLSAFKGNNLLEQEITDLLNSDSISYKKLRIRLFDFLMQYSSNSILNHYKLTENELAYYGHLFGIDVSSIMTGKKTKNDVPENYSLIQPGDKIYKEQETINNNMKIDTVTTVDKYGSVLDVKRVEIANDNTADYERMNKERLKKYSLYKTPISIITFLNLPEDERRERLEVLTDECKLSSSEIEKILGISSGEYLRKIKSRHKIFDFYNKDKLKEELSKLKTFDECQDLVFDIIQNKRYSEFKLPSDESGFIRFAERYFDIFHKKDEWVKDNWTTFYNKVVSQAIYVYKKNSRVTNLTEEEVLQFEKDNRKLISDKDLIRITRIVIKDIHEENQNWISIFDFKTAIEKEDFELDSNERLIKIIDELIAKKSFKNEFFTLKKIPLENPILSDESSIRWEFVNITPPTKNIAKDTKNDILYRENIVDGYRVPEALVTGKVNIPDSTSLSVPNKKKDFIKTNEIALSFDESNIDDIVEFIKYNLKIFGSGNMSINMYKNN